MTKVHLIRDGTLIHEFRRRAVMKKVGKHYLDITSKELNTQVQHGACKTYQLSLDRIANNISWCCITGKTSHVLLPPTPHCIVLRQERRPVSQLEILGYMAGQLANGGLFGV